MRGNPTGAGRPRMLVLNQYYWPGVEATAHLLSELTSALADEYDVRVVTGKLQSHRDALARETRDGVEIVRVNSTSFDRSQLPQRAANYVTYLLESAREALRGPRPDIVVCMTDPPVVANVALFVARRYRAPLVVISQDVFPEIAVEVGRLTNSFVVTALRVLVSSYLRRADRIVAIGETMRRRLVEKGAPSGNVSVIPNWVDTEKLQPQPKANPWSRSRKLAGRFVVMHSGNVGHAQDLDSLVRSLTFLRDLADLRAVIIGRGARHAELVELSERLEVERAVEFLPYQSRDELSRSLSAADVHVVGLARGLAGYVVPSRFYGILSVARPVIVAADDESETARIVREVGCGVVVPPGRPELLARAIRDAYDGKLDLEEMGRAGREWVSREADVRVAVQRYRQLFEEVRAARS
ncbi:MAG TPA: glycosyltransferase family 4 protein [Gaiellaceae bacterium]|nr:glycosyltransferase family 4 protein [Gaiellaceae bacterium]